MSRVNQWARGSRVSSFWVLNFSSYVKVGLGIWEFCEISHRLISKIWFPHPISVADKICRTRFDLRDSKHWALENQFCVRICLMFLISKCRGDWDLGLCTASVLALSDPKCNGKIRFFLRWNTFFFRILPSRIRSPSESTEVQVLKLGTYSKFARKINFLALGVYCLAGQSAFRRSRPQLKLGEEIESSRLVDD